jgi:hypothetical protein
MTEVKAVDRARWHDDQAGRLDCPRPAVDEGLAAPAGDVEHLDQRIVDVRLDVEVETAGTQGNAFVMHHIDRGLADFRAIEREMQNGPAALFLMGHDARYVLLWDLCRLFHRRPRGTRGVQRRDKLLLHDLSRVTLPAARIGSIMIDVASAGEHDALRSIRPAH